MTLGKDELIEIGAIIIGALALFLFLRHSTGAGAQSGATVLPSLQGGYTAPSYLNYNFPASDSSASTSLNSVQPATLGPAAQAQQPCACGSGPVQFTNSGAFYDYLTAQNEAAVSGYYDAVRNSLPYWLSEFVNNTLAPDETAAATGNFASLAGR